MEERSEKIIVYRSYDSVVDANLAKTKLDAYGIPCFLSDENFSSWYPLKADFFSGVRLHIFEGDRMLADNVLREEPDSDTDT